MLVSKGPDVCLTPRGGTMVPVPYSVVAFMDGAIRVSKSVRNNGCYDFQLNSRCTQIKGHKQGVGKGVVVPGYQQYSHVRVASDFVYSEGFATVSHRDPAWINHPIPDRPSRRRARARRPSDGRGSVGGGSMPISRLEALARRRRSTFRRVLYRISRRSRVPNPACRLSLHQESCKPRKVQERAEKGRPGSTCTANCSGEANTGSTAPPEKTKDKSGKDVLDQIMYPAAIGALWMYKGYEKTKNAAIIFTIFPNV